MGIGFTKASYPLKEDPSIRRSYLSKELITGPPKGDIKTVADVLPYCVSDCVAWLNDRGGGGTIIPSEIYSFVHPLILALLPILLPFLFRPEPTATRPLPLPGRSRTSSRRRRRSPRKEARMARPRKRHGSTSLWVTQSPTATRRFLGTWKQSRVD